MLRSIFPRSAVVLLALAAAGCSSQTSNPPSDMGALDAHVPDLDAAVPLDAGVGLQCGALLTCDQKCGSSGSCTDGCYARATAHAQGLFNAFDDCLNTQCSSADGGACESSSSSACSNCNTSAATGACLSFLAGCESDTTEGPPNPDGGATAPPDAGESYNCGELNTCLAGCPGDGGAGCTADCNAKATPAATALEASLTACLAMACPSTPGGPCEMPGLACSGCIEQVTLAQPNTCAAPYVACNGDRSNLPGGSSDPTVLLSGAVLHTVLTGLDQDASTILVSNGYLYFTQVVTGGPVYRLRLDQGGFGDGGLGFGDGGITAGGDGGVTLESVGPPQPTPVSIAIDANNLYVWSVGTFQLNSSVNNRDGAVVQVPLDGSAPITLASNVEAFYDAGYLNAVAVDSQYVYFVTGAAGSDGAIKRVPIGGGTVDTLYTGQAVPQAVVTDGTNLYWADWGTFDSQGRSNDDGTVWQGPVGGGTPILLASNQEAPSTMVFDSQNVYWVNVGHLGTSNFPALNSGSLVKVPIGGGTLTTIADHQAVPFSLILSGGTLYWSEYGLSGPGLLMSAPTAGGSVVPLVSGLNDPSALAISGKTLLWTNANSSPTDGFILSLTLP